MLTPMGKLVRKLRVDNGEKLKDMAEAFKKPPSYLSAIENGRKAIPDWYVDAVYERYKHLGVNKAELVKLASDSGNQMKIDLSQADDMEREAYLAVGRRFKSLPLDKKRQILDLLKESDE